MDVYTVEPLGPKRSRTHDGFLLCQDVCIGRTGELLYLPGEVDVEANGHHVLRVSRDEDTVFDPRAISSFAGKPVVNDHPSGLVTAENWRDYAVGVVLSPRRGTGDLASFLVADLLITDAKAIRDVEAGKRAVSCGYDCEYEQTGPGQGRQRDILGNHVALVKAGRCGERCAILDHATIEDSKMATKPKKARSQALRRFADELADALDDDAASQSDAAADEGAGGDDANGNGTHVHVHLAPGQNGAAAAEGADDAASATSNAAVMATLAAMDQRLAAVESFIASQAAPDTEEEGQEADPENSENETEPEDAYDSGPDKDDVDEETAADEAEAADATAAAAETQEEDDDDMTTKDAKPVRKSTVKSVVRDSAGLVKAVQLMHSRAEILVPGFRTITLDAKRSRDETVKAMCAFRREVLTKALGDATTAKIIAPLVASPDRVRAFTCDALAGVYAGSAELMRVHNNRPAYQGGSITFPAVKNKPPTPAELNAKYAAFYAKHSP